MPDLQTAPVLPSFDIESAPYLKLGQTPEEHRALELVNQTFTKYESQRQSREMKWREADRLYHAQVEQRMWDGTDKPRASLPVPLCFDQIESVYPHIVTALFGETPYWFGVEATDGAEPKDAANLQAAIGRDLESPYDETGLTACTNLCMTVKQAEKYGDGAASLVWDGGQERFIVEWLDIRDLYFDTTIKGPVIDWSPSVIVRKMIQVEDLIAMRGTDGVNIPGDEVLAYLAAMRNTRVADQTRQQQAGARNEHLALYDARVDPIQREVEVLEYWTKSRMIWVFGGQWVAVNSENPYGFIPFMKVPLIPVEGQAWGIGMCEMLRGDQTYAQGIRNLRLDNLNLAMNPPRVRARGTETSPSKISWRPGMIDEVGDPKQSEVLKVDNYTQGALGEEQIIHGGAQKRFGVNDMSQSGVPTPSNANRTGQGVGAQMSATNMRLSTIVKSFEDYLIVPMLYKIQRMLQRFAPEVLEQGTNVTPKTVMGTPVRFIMRGASKMIVREKLASMVVPITQTLFNDVIMKQATVQGKTLDFDEFERFFQDATGTTETYSFFRQMSPEETQQSQQPDPETMAKMQAAQMQAQTQMQIAQTKGQVELQKTERQAQSRDTQTAEESARKLVELLQQVLGQGVPDSAVKSTEKKPA